jgi:hypothetical protein
VQEEDRFAPALVDVVHLASVEVEPMRGEDLDPPILE